MVLSVLNGPARILRNTGNVGQWIRLRLNGTESNRMGIGARVRVTTSDGLTEYNHVTTSSGFASSSDVRLQFGLGAAQAAKEVEILWPSGIRQVLRNLPAGRTVDVIEPSRAAARKPVPSEKPAASRSEN